MEAEREKKAFFWVAGDDDGRERGDDEGPSSVQCDNF